MPAKRNIWLERELEQRETGRPKYVQMGSSFYPWAAPELTPQEWELIGTIGGSDGSDWAAIKRLQATVKDHLPSGLLESMVCTFMASSPELVQYYETADQSTRERMSWWTKCSVLEMWRADLKASFDAAHSR
jgi:hypothetical protein